MIVIQVTCSDCGYSTVDSYISIVSFLEWARVSTTCPSLDHTYPRGTTRLDRIHYKIIGTNETGKTDENPPPKPETGLDT